MARFKDPDDYVKKQSAAHQLMLEDLRILIKSIIPEAVEHISFSIICYQYHYMLVGIGTKKGHCSFYTMNPDYLESIKSELAGYDYTNSTLYLPLGKTLPQDLLARIIQDRIQENEFRAIAQGKI